MFSRFAGRNGLSVAWTGHSLRAVPLGTLALTAAWCGGAAFALGIAARAWRKLRRRDRLTGLYNGRGLLTRLQSVLTARAADNADLLPPVAVAVVDIDRFRWLNESLGYKAGDEVLKVVARRLEGCVADRGTGVARMDGDTFAWVMPGLGDRAAAARFVSRVVDEVCKGMTVGGRLYRPTLSAGIAVYPDDGAEAGVLLRHAATALHAAQAEGRGVIRTYDPAMSRRFQEQFHLESELLRALANGEFVLHYQPRVQLSTGAMSGVEALLRWQHPSLGLLPPSRFIDVAEETGLIVPIGEWVIHAACRQVKQWQAEGLPPLRVAVNISPRQFQRDDVVAVVAQALEEHGVDPAWFEVEITEQVFMGNIDEANRKIHAFRRMGVCVAIDDFGVGYASLSTLKHFPVDCVKIDRSFIRDVPASPEDAAIVSAVIELGHSLRLRVVGEGVETPEQRMFLEARRCDEVQGYYFSHPVPPEKIPNLWRNMSRREKSGAGASLPGCLCTAGLSSEP